MQSNIRIIELLRFLYQQTDEAHAVTVSEMIEYLKSKGIPSVRQTVYTDLEALDTAGIDMRSLFTANICVGSAQTHP